MDGKFATGACLSLFALAWTVFNGANALSAITFILGIIFLAKAQSDFDNE